MKILLTETISKIGVVGEVVDVTEGYARNYLIPKKLAVEPTDGNIKRFEAARKEYEAHQKLLRQQKEQLCTALEGVEISVVRASNEEGHLFGSVSRRDISEELQKLGHAITPDDVRLDEPLRRIDTFTVPIQLAADLKAQVKVWVVREKAAEGEAAAATQATASEAPEPTAAE